MDRSATTGRNFISSYSVLLVTEKIFWYPMYNPKPKEMSDWITNTCVAGAVIWFTLLAYRLYFNAPDSYDIGEDPRMGDVTEGMTDQTPDTAGPSLDAGVQTEIPDDVDLAMQEIYETADEGVDTTGSLIPEYAR